MSKTDVAAVSSDQRLFQITEERRTEPVAMLRGAQIEADPSRVGKVVAAVIVAAIAVSAVVLFVVGAHKNAQITELRDHGVPVEVTVAKCLGLMGGSGSNGAGYDCTGSFELQGHRFDEAIPDDVFYRPGARIQAVAAENASGLFAPTAVLAKEHASPAVFIVPALLSLAFVLLSGEWVRRRRRLHPAHSKSIRPTS